jgi:lipopolysaccharide transport system ATP-binding protein
MSTAILVENVSKAYRLGTIGGATLKEDFGRWWAKVRDRDDPLSKIGEEHHARRIGEKFWALQNVSFEVQEGEVLGIIGRNGAGKSTLLKILSQVTAPTSGEIKIKGRIASLLEVGTGFHPELTGRENVYLNGAILGMTKVEIRRKFDEIVAFSGIEEFIETPVKRYSSGMYVRLAFAVAAHLEPEILIVDEVLAVGDAEFQKKCLGKIQDVSRGGRTVLFVSHDHASVRRLCTEIVLLDQGSVRLSGKPSDVIAAYLHDSNRAENFSQRNGDGNIRITQLEILDESGRPSNCLKLNEMATFRFHCEAKRNSSRVMFAVAFSTPENGRVLSLYSSYHGQEFDVRSPSFIAECKVRLRLMPGDYQLTTHIESAGILADSISEARMITVHLDNDPQFLTPPNLRQGCIIEDFDWRVIS